MITWVWIIYLVGTVSSGLAKGNGWDVIYRSAVLGMLFLIFIRVASGIPEQSVQPPPPVESSTPAQQP